MNYGSVKILKVVSFDRPKMDKGVNLAQKCYNYQMNVLVIGLISVTYQSKAITCAFIMFMVSTRVVNSDLKYCYPRAIVVC